METEFIARTYRSAAFVTGFVLFVLASYGQFWALLPVAAGAALGMVLLRFLEVTVRRTFTRERAADARKNRKGSGPGRALLGFALVKYPLVALLIWAVVRVWDAREVMAFTAGFILLQMVIGLRAMGRYMVDQMNESAAKAERMPRGGKSRGGLRETGGRRKE